MAAKQRARTGPAAASDHPVAGRARDGVRTNVVPDRLDLRDRTYQPSIARCPAPSMRPRRALPVLDQGDTSACTGFALATVVGLLLRAQDPRAPLVSPHMLYSMARRYDEFPGNPARDQGSSVRGALKGWYKHGACRADLWPSPDMPPPARTPAKDWWLDAAQRPLGAYYRVDTRSVTDLQVALQEVGVVYASAVCHDGWLEGFDLPRTPRGTWCIPARRAAPRDGGHAFAIVGYDRRGFLVQNSWGARWGARGLAVLAYDDWLDHAMDAWVAQRGVVTDQHLEIARSVSLRVHGGRVALAADEVLRNRELSPFIVNTENDGRLSSTGEFRTSRPDLEALTTVQAEEARRRFGLGAAEPLDVVLYAHGGLVSEKAGADVAARWVPALYEARMLPVFLLWETGLLDTLGYLAAEAVAGQPRPTGGAFDALKRFWNARLEALLARPGSAVWGEMKENADRLTSHPEGGGTLLFDAADASPLLAPGRVRLHLVGHSAGSIVLAHLVDRVCRRGRTFASVTFLAPAVRRDVFEATVLPWLRDGAVRRYLQWHLTERAEQTDPTCTPILGYSRSLLWLVSRAFEGGEPTPILGMAGTFDAARAAWDLGDRVAAAVTPSEADENTTHGGFDGDGVMRRVIEGLRAAAAATPTGAPPRARRRR